MAAGSPAPASAAATPATARLLPVRAVIEKLGSRNGLLGLPGTGQRRSDTRQS